jgi:hypothetical protein
MPTSLRSATRTRRLAAECPTRTAARCQLWRSRRVGVDGMGRSAFAVHGGLDYGVSVFVSIRVRVACAVPLAQWTANVVVRGDLPVPQRHGGISSRARVPRPRRCTRLGDCRGRARNGRPTGGVPRAGWRLALGRTLTWLSCGSVSSRQSTASEMTLAPDPTGGQASSSVRVAAEWGRST